MKRKYYLRGIGVGILFATIVLLVAYAVTGGGEMSEEEIIERAEALGMVQEESLLDSFDKPAEKTDTEDSAALETDTETTESTGEDNADDTSSTEHIETTETEPETTEETAATDVRIVTFTVVSGMNSWNVAKILEDQGVIESADEFDAYLESNGYSASIVTGEYSVSIDSDYETIAKLITGNE